MNDISPQIEALEVAHLISLTVLDDMRLFIEPAQIARDAEHNSATFVIARQPASLDGFVCRAEVQNSKGTNYRLVEDGQFTLSSDIAVAGMGYLQLVYSDGASIIRKTYPAPFHVSPSVNALDESDPDFQNGLAQLQAAAFTQVSGSDTTITFYNTAGTPVGVVIYPPGSGGGLDEATADTLYLRLNGAGMMQGSVGIEGPNRGIVWGASGVQGALYSDGTQLAFRRPLGDPDIVIENNSGNATTRSPIVTVLSGDQRYLREINANSLYLALDGGQMRGPLISQPGGSLTNPGLGIGDNATGFFRSGSALLLSVGGALYAQWLQGPPSMMLTVPLNMATQPITNVPDPAALTDAANRRYVDAAVGGVPRRPARVFIASEVTIGVTPTEFFNQPFFTNDNTARTILVTVQLQFAQGDPSTFYDLEYTTGLSAGLFERISIYPTPGSYMGGTTVVFAATVTPIGSQIQVQLLVRQVSNQVNPLVQVGSRANQRSYVIIEEMSN